MWLLWAGNLVVTNVQFSHIVPCRPTLMLTAKKVAGKKILNIQDVKGQYADWLFSAKNITLNILRHTVQLGKMTMDCMHPSVQIQAQSGVLNLQAYNAVIQSVRLTHCNMVFTCPKAIYDHQKQQITCVNGRMEINKYRCLNKGL